MCQAIGHPVIRLNRPIYGFLGVEGMAPGEWRHLDPQEVEMMKREAEKSSVAAAAEPRRKSAGGAAVKKSRRPSIIRRPRVKA
jgi:hypothetical protein